MCRGYASGRRYRVKNTTGLVLDGHKSWLNTPGGLVNGGRRPTKVSGRY